MKAFLVGPKGGQVDLVDRATGEVVNSFHVSPGVYPWARFAAFLGSRYMLHGATVIQTQGNVETCKPVGQFESSANPFWRITPAQKQVNELRRLLARTEVLNKRTAKMQQAMRRAKAATPALMAPAPEVGGAGDVSAS